MSKAVARKPETRARQAGNREFRRRQPGMQGEPRGVGRCGGAPRPARCRDARSVRRPHRGEHVHGHGGGREEDPQGRAPRPARERPCPRAGHRLRRRHRRRVLRGARRARERGGEGPAGAGHRCPVRRGALFSRRGRAPPYRIRLPHARGREGAGRLRQRVHVLHRARGARARDQPSGRRRRARVRGLRPRRRAGDRAHGYQPGVVLRRRTARPLRDQAGRSAATPARRDG